ncbi:MAG: CBS domain-containing protein, partial [Gammaproteobacteria bacterium]
MALEIKTLPLVTISTSLPCIRPERNRHPLTEDNPALEVMTDFMTVTPVTAEPFHSLDFALDRMKTMGVRMLLITDEHDNIDGVITSYDLQSEKPVRYAEANDLGYDEINIGMIMTPVT